MRMLKATIVGIAVLALSACGDEAESKSGFNFFNGSGGGGYGAPVSGSSGGSTTGGGVVIGGGGTTSGATTGGLNGDGGGTTLGGVSGGSTTGGSTDGFQDGTTAGSGTTDGGTTSGSGADGGTTSGSGADGGTTSGGGTTGGGGTGVSPDWCADGPKKKYAFSPSNKESKVYYGTSTPTHVPLSEQQQWAIGSFNGCTGTLIAPRWVLSAEHCGLWWGQQFCMGKDPKNPNVCIAGKAAYNHPFGDIALLELSQDATTVLPGVEPIPIFTGTIDSSWMNRTVEASGYGQQENGAFNEREFTAEPIVWIGADTLTIDGQGKHGVCFGDSGGPLLGIDDSGSTRVIGDLSNGADSCVGQDNYTRVDTYKDWVESYTGPTVLPGPQPCGNVTIVGSCNQLGTQAKYCGDDGLLKVDNCGAGITCSWSAGSSAWRCVDVADDACDGVTAWGSCGNNSLSWCDAGGKQTRDCGSCGETCVPNDQWGYWCVPSECGDLQFTGECDGDSVRWCNREGKIEMRSCSQSNQTCGWVDQSTGYWCQ